MGLHPKPRDLHEVRTDDPIELSTRVIDEGVATEPVNRVSNVLTEIDDDVAVVESFSHMVVFRTDEGLVSFDASGKGTGVAVNEALRGWRTDRVHSLIYTHGHVDHVGGSGAVLADAEARGYNAPVVVGHENVPRRLERYDKTSEWNQIINRRQFGGVSPRAGLSIAADLPTFLPSDAAWPTVTYQDSMTINVGGLEMHLHHGKGETDDHTWAWIPERKAICTGDLVVWVFPNAGNPQKVQRFPGKWAAELRKMIALEPELLLPAHGLPVRGTARITRVLTDMADALEGLVRDTVAMMNGGASLNEIVHTVKVDDDKISLPWLQPVYDEPEFVVRNIWRLYGGWWDADPANLKPSTTSAVASEVTALAGGSGALVARAQELADAGDFRLACHLIEFAANADPADRTVHGARAEIYRARRAAESSLMSKGIYAAAMRESEAIANPTEQE